MVTLGEWFPAEVSLAVLEGTKEGLQEKVNPRCRVMAQGATTTPCRPLPLPGQGSTEGGLADYPALCKTPLRCIPSLPVDHMST